jgi:hypothetical protein
MINITCPISIDTGILGSRSTTSLGSDKAGNKLDACSGRVAVSFLGSQMQQALVEECCSSHIGCIMMTRSEILSVRSSIYCQHITFHTCPIVDVIKVKFGPDFDFFEPPHYLTYFGPSNLTET